VDRVQFFFATMVFLGGVGIVTMIGWLLLYGG
jgi:hypothetical protein